MEGDRGFVSRGGCGYYVSNRVMCISGVGVGGKRFDASARRFRRSDCSCQSPRRMRLEMPGSRFESGQNHNFMIYNIYIYIYAETVYNSLLKRKNWNLKNSRFQILRRINVIETLSTWNISQLVSQIQWIRNNSIFFSILFPLFHIGQFLCRLFCTPRCNLLRFQHIVFARLERMFRKQKRKKK